MLEGVYIDNCCKWRTLINNALPEVPVKFDLFISCSTENCEKGSQEKKTKQGISE